MFARDERGKSTVRAIIAVWCSLGARNSVHIRYEMDGKLADVE